MYEGVGGEVIRLPPGRNPTTCKGIVAPGVATTLHYIISYYSRSYTTP